MISRSELIHQAQQSIKRTLEKFDITVVRHSSYKSVAADAQARADLKLLLEIPHEHAPRLLDLLPKSKAQYRQDLFALSELGWKRNGFFVEFGATNGVDISNTHLLEKEFCWSGILAEPARLWHSQLKSNRRCAIETDCVWKETGATLTFREVARAELSTIDSFTGSDVWRKAREQHETYNVKTVSLNDLLKRHNAPQTIDFMSIDTEGSELDILRAFDFTAHDIRIITVEHNFTPQRAELYDLLTTAGYVRKYEAISQYDDWYVKP